MGDLFPRFSEKVWDIRGAVSLTFDVISGITDLVEAMHHTIADLGGILGGSNQVRTRGITEWFTTAFAQYPDWWGMALIHCLNSSHHHPKKIVHHRNMKWFWLR